MAQGYSETFAELTRRVLAGDATAKHVLSDWMQEHGVPQSAITSYLDALAHGRTRFEVTMRGILADVQFVPNVASVHRVTLVTHHAELTLTHASVIILGDAPTDMAQVRHQQDVMGRCYLLVRNVAAGRWWRVELAYRPLYRFPLPEEVRVPAGGSVVIELEVPPVNFEGPAVGPVLVDVALTGLGRA